MPKPARSDEGSDTTHFPVQNYPKPDSYFLFLSADFVKTWPESLIDHLNEFLSKGNVRIIATDDTPIQNKCAQVIQDMVNHEFRVGRGMDFLMKVKPKGSHV